MEVSGSRRQWWMTPVACELFHGEYGSCTHSFVGYRQYGARRTRAAITCRAGRGPGTGAAAARPGRRPGVRRPRSAARQSARSTPAAAAAPAPCAQGSKKLLVVALTLRGLMPLETDAPQGGLCSAHRTPVGTPLAKLSKLRCRLRPQTPVTLLARPARGPQDLLGRESYC